MKKFLKNPGLVLEKQSLKNHVNRTDSPCINSLKNNVKSVDGFKKKIPEYQTIQT